MDKTYNDKMIRLFTLLEEYKYLMASTKCDVMREYFKERFQENCRKVDELLQERHIREYGNGRICPQKAFVQNQSVVEERQYTLEELSKYNGRNGMPAYVAVNGIVYDVSSVGSWGGGTHFGLAAGEELTEEYNNCHGGADIISKLPKVGKVIG